MAKQAVAFPRLVNSLISFDFHFHRKKNCLLPETPCVYYFFDYTRYVMLFLANL